jgi:hypothetical protein
VSLVENVFDRSASYVRIHRLLEPIIVGRTTVTQSIQQMGTRMSRNLEIQLFLDGE